MDKLCGTSMIGVGVFTELDSLIDKYCPSIRIRSGSSAELADTEALKANAVAIAESVNLKPCLQILRAEIEYVCPESHKLVRWLNEVMNVNANYSRFQYCS